MTFISIQCIIFFVQEFENMLLNFKEACHLCLKSGSDLHSILNTTGKFQEKIQTASPTVNVTVSE
jgi:hypothetical protein